MRRALFGLLILLTAFRGMVGDAMAYEMSMGLAQHSLASNNSIEPIAPGANFVTATDHFASEQHTAMPCHGAAEEASANAPSHDCNACQVCHSPALQRSSLLASLMHAPTAYAQREDRDWLSADLTPLQKPPVS
jgi:hypothetical protein